jgi:hypothetical protein
MNSENVNSRETSMIRFYIEGSRRLSNFFWAIVISLGGTGFFSAGLCSYFKLNFFILSDASKLLFIPQGIVLLFYGTVGLILGTFLCLNIWWDIGFGYNEYNKEANEIILYRKGFPGKNRELRLVFSIDDAKSIKMRIKEGLNPRRQLFLCLNDSREIPLTGIDQPISLSALESKAVDLAKYLNIYLETE